MKKGDRREREGERGREIEGERVRERESHAVEVEVVSVLFAKQ